jgi:Arc/MetJ family transcription regulator
VRVPAGTGRDDDGLGEQYLLAAQRALDTETKKDTVNAALREVAAL